MKLLLALLILVGGYFYLLSHTTDVVLSQTQHLEAQYQYMTNNADRIAAGK